MSKHKKKLLSIAIVGTLALSSIGASTALASSEDLTPEVTEITAEQKENGHDPEAIPAVAGAVVGLPFAGAAAKAAGEKVGEWVADKVIGIWNAEEEIEEEANLDVIFD
ncbi:hypothetical protein [Virgibacillus kimchii]